MSVTETHATWRATCDCCGTIETMEFNGRPKHWINLHIIRDAYDFQGYAVADASVKLLLCVPCSERAVTAVNSAFDTIRAALEGATKP